MFRSLRVKVPVTSLQKYPKQSFFVFTWFMVTFNLKMISNVKMISIKSVFTSNPTFIDLQKLLSAKTKTLQ